MSAVLEQARRIAEQTTPAAPGGEQQQQPQGGD
jgi:hypothetical protein